jgi:methylated-DNA-[protein]-cysteine S-methyltransferase
MAVQRKRVLGCLVSLTYDARPPIAWRAVEAMGLAADRLAEHDPECVRSHLRRLYWLISEESGGICWHAPQAMAEIVRLRPALFDDYLGIVISLLREMAEEDLDHFRPGVLWAIGRLGPLAEGHLPGVLAKITSALEHPDPQVRGMAVWCLGQVGRTDVLADRPELARDEGPVDLYEDGQFGRTSVGRLTQRALGNGPGPPG